MYVNTMEDDSLSSESSKKNLKRKAAANANINLSGKHFSKFKRISVLIRKQDKKGLTEEERNYLQEHSNLVDQYYKRREVRAVSKLRQTELEDTREVLEKKCVQLAQAIHDAEFLVVYTGAGISTAASIPDYRGPNGIWTLLQKGQDVGSHDLSAAEPTLTHMAISKLYHEGIVRHVVSQNCDGLHLRSGLPKTAMSEVHGNMYIEVCTHCIPAREYVRTFDVTERTSVRKHTSGRRCYRCGEPLVDTIVHFGERGRLRWPLNWQGACQAANACDTILCFGSSLKVLKKYPWLWQMDRHYKRRPSLYIVNLQWTPKDKDATLKINGKCDDVMVLVMKTLGYDIPKYSRNEDTLFSIATPLHEDERGTTTRPFLMLALEDENFFDTASSEMLKSEVCDKCLNKNKCDCLPDNKSSEKILNGDSTSDISDIESHLAEVKVESPNGDTDEEIIKQSALSELHTKDDTSSHHKNGYVVMNKFRSELCSNADCSDMPYVSNVSSPEDKYTLKHEDFYGTGLCIRSFPKEKEICTFNSDDDDDYENCVSEADSFSEHMEEKEDVKDDGSFSSESKLEEENDESLNKRGSPCDNYENEEFIDVCSDGMTFFNLQPVKVDLPEGCLSVKDVADKQYLLHTRIVDGVIKATNFESSKDDDDNFSNASSDTDLTVFNCDGKPAGSDPNGVVQEKEKLNELKDLWFWGFDSSAPNSENIQNSSSCENDTEDASSCKRLTRSSTRHFRKENVKCHCLGMNPKLCMKSHRRRVEIPWNDSVMRARAVMARHRTYNYRRYEPVFELSLDSIVYKREKPKRRARYEYVEESDEDDDSLTDFGMDATSKSILSEYTEMKNSAKIVPGWYGKGYRKLIKKKTRWSL